MLDDGFGVTEGCRACETGEGLLVLVIGHSGASEVALLHVHGHAAILHVTHHLELLWSHVGPHLAQEFLLLVLFHSRLLL